MVAVRSSGNMDEVDSIASRLGARIYHDVRGRNMSISDSCRMWQRASVFKTVVQVLAFTTIGRECDHYSLAAAQRNKKYGR